MASLSEDEIIARYFAPLAGPAGLGLRDDAALLTPPRGADLVVTKDVLVAGGHFFADDPPEKIAKKALRVNISDLTAKGARPIGFLLGLSLPQGVEERWIAEFSAGLAADARLYDCPLLGGDTVKGPLSISITALGAVKRGTMIRRDRVQVGDALFVCGAVGESALGLRILLDAPQDRHWIAGLSGEARAYLVEAYHVPRVISRVARALQGCAHAAMDVSDGLVGDLTKMLKVSGVSAHVKPDLSLFFEEVLEAMRLEPKLGDVALTGGDDYVVLCAVPQDKKALFERRARRGIFHAIEIGTAIEGTEPPIFFDFDGKAKSFERKSFSHF